VPDSGFDIESDSRKFAVKNYHRLDVGRNISASVTVDLGCLACASPHSIREELGTGNAKVIVLSDQAFPPHLPTDDGRCVVVIRVEDGVLSELVSVFKDIFATFVGNAGGFPPGSVILFGSLSHLGRRGVCNYTEELVRCVGSLSAGVGAGVEVVPMVFFPMGGIDDPGVVRDAHDLDSWIMGSALGTGVGLGGARAALWEELREAGGGRERLRAAHSSSRRPSGILGSALSTLLLPIPPCQNQFRDCPRRQRLGSFRCLSMNLCKNLGSLLTQNLTWSAGV
jgi:hypothetical protein